jgi:hypothetical protein
MFAVPDPDGVDSVYAVIKATFTLGDKVAPAAEQLPVRPMDEYTAEPGRSSLKAVSDLSLVKPGTDVLLFGSAFAPAGQKVPQTEVTLAVGPVRKTVRVFGDRTWKPGLLGDKATPPIPFDRMPLVWERAFGGTDVTTREPPQMHAENRNPVGAGFFIKDGQKNREGLKLPNLENPKQLISSTRDRPEPMALGPIPGHWEPRRNYAGTYDEAWQKKRAPYLPKDFDARFFQVAPPDQVVPAYLKGGEPVEVLGATPSGVLRFRLPEYRIDVTYRLDDGDHIRPAQLDTVILEPGLARLCLVWRSVFPCDKKVLRVREVVATATPGG